MKKYFLVFALLILTLSVYTETPSASVVPSIEVGFSPGGTTVKLVLDVIGEAKSSILVACYSFTNRDIAEAL